MSTTDLVQRFPPTRFLRRWWLRHRQFRGGVAVLDALYEKPDPWHLAKPREQSRFEATNALIKKHVPDCHRLLEVGCGEGMQTKYLLDVAGEVTGLEGSVRALERARSALPNVTFIHGDFEHKVPALAGQTFTLVTMCEMLCHLDDPQAAVWRAQALADQVLVTMYEPLVAPLRTIFLGAQWHALPEIEAGGRRWQAFIWRRKIKTPFQQKLRPGAA